MDKKLFQIWKKIILKFLFVRKINYNVSGAEAELLHEKAERQKLEVTVTATKKNLAKLTEETQKQQEELETLKQKESQHDCQIEELREDMNVMKDERDAMEQGLHQAWEEKNQLTEDLHYLQESYVHISDQLGDERNLREEAEENAMGQGWIFTNLVFKFISIF